MLGTFAEIKWDKNVEVFLAQRLLARFMIGLGSSLIIHTQGGYILRIEESWVGVLI